MIPVYSLEEDTYDTIRSNAIQSIVRYQEMWTNYNPSDSGITLLELLAWMQEMQEFYLNRYGEENKQLYLELLGMKPYGLAPAGVMTEVLIDQERKIYPNTGFLTDSIYYEPEAEGMLGIEKLQFCYAQKEDGTLLWSSSEEELQYGKWMFGEQPRPGNRFYVSFDQPIPLSCRHVLYLELELPEGLKRNPVPRGKKALFSQFQMEYWDGSGWKPCKVLEDETAGFLQSGCIHWQAEGEMKALENSYWIRLRLLACDFDLPPRLRQVSTRRIRLLQKETLAASLEIRIPMEEEGIYKVNLEEYTEAGTETEVFIKEGECYHKAEICFREGQKLGFCYLKKQEPMLTVLLVISQKNSRISLRQEACGFPGQVIALEDCQIMGSSLRLMVEREDHPGEYRFWKPVTHFWKAASDGECYRFQEETGQLYFGDGYHGKIPEGSIILTDCVRTMGLAGGVKEQTCFQWKGGRAYSWKEACGGRNPEKEIECMERFWQQAENEERAVTEEDYETLVQQTPGLIIQKVKAVKGRDNSITLVVEGGGKSSTRHLHPVYQREIREWLEEKRMLGTRLLLEAPRYISIRVHAVIRVYERYHQAEDWIRQRIKEFFCKYMKEFGAEFQYSMLYGSLDGLSCVSGIHSLMVTPSGKEIRQTRDGSFRLPERGLAVLEEIQIQLIQENRG